MSSKIDLMKKEVRSVIARGGYLYLAMLEDVSGLSEEIEQKLKENKSKLPNFIADYDSWYSEALALVKQLLPDRLDDFKRQYKDEKRKDISFLTYGISDYLYGLRTTRGYQEDVVADKSAAVGKMQVQNSIIAAVEKRLESSLFDIQQIVQADLFDSELSAARELAKKGFVRGGGAIAGVVLEKHLGHVCEMHGLKSRKKHPSIADYYQLLKEDNVVDTPKWRLIQHLGDLRNLCNHSKDREPTNDDVLELVEGVEKVIKTVF